MKQFLVKLSNTLIIMSVIGFLAGVASLVWPSISLRILITLFAITIVSHGVLQIQSAVQHKDKTSNWWLWALMGLVNIAGGLLAFFNPGITTIFLVWIVGTTWLVSGALQIYFSIKLRKEIKNEGWLALAGILTVIAGFIMIGSPTTGSIALVWIIASYLILFSAILFIFGKSVKTWEKDVVRFFDESIPKS
jgi:uncharacterized membrane protein HdeD (DUF308 family)